MSLASLFGAQPKDIIKETGVVVKETGQVLDGLFTSDEERLTHQEVMERLELKKDELAVKLYSSINKSSTDIGVIYAKSDKFFDRGWRPWIGWVCGISIALYFIPQFVLGAFFWAVACIGAETIPPYPVELSQGLWQLVTALLGMAGIRQVDKIAGKAR